MSEPYLILHKVRGQPAYDIAQRTEIAGEEAWILTCGYRAYPIQANRLEATLKYGCIGMLDDRMPEDARDCFACNDRPQREESYAVRAKAAGLLQSLGLIKKIERRV